MTKNKKEKVKGWPKDSSQNDNCLPPIKEQSSVAVLPTYKKTSFSRARPTEAKDVMADLSDPSCHLPKIRNREIICDTGSKRRGIDQIGLNVTSSFKPSPPQSHPPVDHRTRHSISVRRNPVHVVPICIHQDKPDFPSKAVLSPDKRGDRYGKSKTSRPETPSSVCEYVKTDVTPALVNLTNKRSPIEHTSSGIKISRRLDLDHVASSNHSTDGYPVTKPSSMYMKRSKNSPVSPVHMTNSDVGFTHAAGPASTKSPTLVHVETGKATRTYRARNINNKFPSVEPVQVGSENRIPTPSKSETSKYVRRQRENNVHSTSTKNNCRQSKALSSTCDLHLDVSSLHSSPTDSPPTDHIEVQRSNIQEIRYRRPIRSEKKEEFHLNVQSVIVDLEPPKAPRESCGSNVALTNCPSPPRTYKPVDTRLSLRKRSYKPSIDIDSIDCITKPSTETTKLYTKSTTITSLRPESRVGRKRAADERGVTLPPIVKTKKKDGR